MPLWSLGVADLLVPGLEVGVGTFRAQDVEVGQVALHNESFLVPIHCAESVLIHANSRSLCKALRKITWLAPVLVWVGDF